MNGERKCVSLPSPPAVCADALVCETPSPALLQCARRGACVCRPPDRLTGRLRQGGVGGVGECKLVREPRTLKRTRAARVRRQRKPTDIRVGTKGFPGNRQKIRLCHAGKNARLPMLRRRLPALWAPFGCAPELTELSSTLSSILNSLLSLPISPSLSSPLFAPG
jgi:hypothetical protein